MSTRVKTDLRHELKYLVRHDQQTALLEELAEHLRPDEHAGGDGQYPITSLYFDTPDHKFYWDKVEGHRVRRKVRVRVYDDRTMTPETHCFLEIKQRVDKLIRKRRVLLPYRDAVDLEAMEQPPATMDASDRAVLQEVYYLYRTLQIQPTCIVRYNRLALQGHELYPDLRVTFDTNLRSRIHDLTLLSTDPANNRFFMPPDFAVLEVKINNNVPYWLTQLLNRHRCTLQRISKYCVALERNRAVADRQRVAVAPGMRLTTRS